MVYLAPPSAVTLPKQMARHSSRSIKFKIRGNGCDRLRFAPLLGILLVLIWGTIAVAHNVEVAGDIAGTWHIEPNHAPKAGEPAQIWIALTRQGGKILPLEQGNCQLGIYAAPRQQGDEPILQPTLKAIAVEQYQGIPAANVVFPKTGLYEVELGCTPKTAGDFAPFQMAYEVTVATGASVPSPTTQIPSPSPNPSASPATPGKAENQVPSNRPLFDQRLGEIVFIGILAVGIIGTLIKRFLKR